MTRFHREQLEIALKAGKISADEDTIKKIDQSLYVLQIVYCDTPGYISTIRCHRPSKELKSLNKAFKEWLSSDNREFEASIFQKPLSTSIEWLYMASKSISGTVTWLELVTRNNRQRERLETTLFIGLYELYVELSGKTTLSDKGPGIRFMRECASILGVDVPEGVRRRIQIAIKARQQERPQL